MGSRLGNYEILDEIGRGGMGRVYRARQPALDRTVAVKVLLPQLAADEVFVERFLREARAIATLEHPGIVTIYDVGEADGTYYFAMQLLDGRPLDDILEERKSLPIETAVHVLSQVARALGYAHAAGILHRDVKPGNIIVTGSGQAVLTDFGIAQALSDTRLTKTGTSIGSPEYMAPEQIEGKALDARSDLYSLGVVFYYMLTGELPYKGESAVAIVYQHVKAPVPSVRDVDPEIPERLDRVVTRLLAKLPEERFGSVEELLEALEREPTRPLERPLGSRRSPWGRRLIAATALIAVVGLGAFYARQGGLAQLRELLAGAVAPAAGEAPEPSAEVDAGSEATEPELAEPLPEAGAESPAEAPAAPVAETLRVTSEPSGATVVLDGETLAETTPVAVELLPGTDYRLRVQLDGHDPAGLNFSLADLTESQRSSGVLHFPLRSSIPPGVVTIAADYPVEVSVAGQTYTSDRIELAPGTYEAALSAPSVYFSDTRRLTIASGETWEVVLPMATSVTVAANPSRCRVKIDGRDAGYVPAEVRLTVGEHLFEFNWESLGESLSLTRMISTQTDRVFATPSQ